MVTKSTGVLGFHATEHAFYLALSKVLPKSVRTERRGRRKLLARECVSTEYCVYATETGTEDNMAGPSGHAGSGCMAVLPSAPDRGNHESSG